MATKYSPKKLKNEITKVALDALAEGRVTDAFFTLTEVMDTYSALEALAPKPEPKLGDILYSSWGYDQTNIDYYQVVEVTKSKASVRIKKIGKNYLGDTNAPQVSVLPVKGAFVATRGDEESAGKLKRVQKSGSGYSLNLTSYSSAWLWDGKPKSETGWAYGH